jgi:transposase
MRDTELYQHLLGLVSPWSVARVELDTKAGRVDVWAEHKRNVDWSCPDCGEICALHDHDEERAWRHLDSCQFQTFLHARIPRIRCGEHGVRQARVPWAEPRSRFTLLFERLAIDVLTETDVLGAAQILRISWDEAHHIMERAVERGLAQRERKVPRRLGVDEKSLARGYRFATILCNLVDGTVVELREGRKKESLEACLDALPQDELSDVEAVAMDMWEPYIRVIEKRVPGGETKIVFDRFHIMMHINEAVDRVRRRENRALIEAGDASLKGTKYWWLYAWENLPEKHLPAFTVLKAANLKTARAWAIKEQLRALWTCPSYAAASEHWRRWYLWASHSRLEPVKRVARMIRDHLVNVLTYFEHRVTNAASEALNSTIQMIKKRAFGFRSFRNFRTAVLFRCGGLQLYPATHPNV